MYSSMPSTQPSCLKMHSDSLKAEYDIGVSKSEHKAHKKEMFSFLPPVTEAMSVPHSSYLATGIPYNSNGSRQGRT